MQGKHCHEVSVHLTEGQPIGYKARVHGRAHHAKRVQLLVFSADGLWYLQKDAVLKANGRWHADCTFGYEDSTHEFFVVALADGEKIKIPTLTDVPANAVVSKKVMVVRTAPEATTPSAVPTV